MDVGNMKWKMREESTIICTKKMLYENKRLIFTYKYINISKQIHVSDTCLLTPPFRKSENLNILNTILDLGFPSVYKFIRTHIVHYIWCLVVVKSIRLPTPTLQKSFSKFYSLLGIAIDSWSWLQSCRAKFVDSRTLNLLGIILGGSWCLLLRTLHIYMNIFPL